MMHPSKYISIVSLMTFLGCTPIHKVQYQSNPPGAVVYCEGKRIGFAPQTVSYKLTEQEEEEGHLRIKDCSAKWISGASQEVGDILFALPQVHYSYSTYLFSRPNFPNYKEDEAFAMEREKIRAMNHIAQSRRASRSSFDDDNDDYHYGRRDRASMDIHSSSSESSEDISSAVSRGLDLVK